MTVEERLADALAAYDDLDANPDLFARVNLSVEADRIHRRRAAKWSAITVAATVAIAASGWMLSTATTRGPTVPGWWVELVAIAVMVAVVRGVGVLLRRIGGDFVTACFPVDPNTGERFTALLDIAYYLLFAGMTVATVSLSDLTVGRPLGVTLERLAERAGWLLVVMGTLHAVTFTVLPIIGLVFGVTARRHLLRDTPPTKRPPDVVLAEQVVRIVLIGLAVLAAIGGVVFMFGLIGGVSGG